MELEMAFTKDPEPGSPTCPLCDGPALSQDTDHPAWGHQCPKFANKRPIYWTVTRLAYIDEDEVVDEAKNH